MLEKLINYCKQENIWLYDEIYYFGKINYDQLRKTAEIFYYSQVKTALFTLSHEIGHYLHYKSLDEIRLTIDNVYQFECIAWDNAFKLLKLFEIDFNEKEFFDYKEKMLETYSDYKNFKGKK